MRYVTAAILASAALTCSAWATETVILDAVKDNSLIETLKGQLGNGGGEFFHTGLTGELSKRRGLVAFDLSSIPAGLTVTGVSLRLNMSMTGTIEVLPVSAHRVLTPWTEGTSDPPFGEGAGALSTPGDATWLHSSYPREFWKSAGGDFDSDALATTMVGIIAPYTWSSDGMIACVQEWVNNPSTNQGFLMHGVETGPQSTSKRFDSHQNANLANRPRLTVQYELPAPACTGDMDASGDVNGVDLGVLLLNWSDPADEAGCGGDEDCPPDLNGDTLVNGIDLGILLVNWGPCKG